MKFHKTFRFLTWIFRWPGRILFFSIIAALTAAQNSKQAQPAKPNAPSGAAQTPSNQLAQISLDGSLALHHLNQTISWYRHSTTGIQSVGLPTDTIYQDNTRSFGAEVVRLAFESAKAESAIITAQQKGESPAPTQSSQTQNLTQLQTKTSDRIDQLQSQIDGLNGQIEKARGTKRDSLVSQRDTVQGEMQLQTALLDALQKMTSFVESNGEAASGLEGGINQLAKSIPEVLGTAANPAKAASAAQPAPSKPALATSGGLIAEAMTFYDYMRAVHQIDQSIRETDYTRDVADRLRNPLRDAMRATIQRSDTLANQAPSTDPQQLQTERQQFQQLTDRFKQLSAALLPLSQEIIVLNDARANFAAWRASIARESKYILRSVLLRVGAIVLALALIFFVSDIWRRVTFRYISDPRRRRQFLVMRRVVISFMVGLVLIFGFVSEFSSLATFAGFITAGIAVGLQAVLLSVAAYFFIIGRYGIRVGDRISVAGVTGDVVDIGLVRMYMIELAGTGVDFYPTGRIVVFSNSVLFQTTTPLFKQIPGTEYSWHEIVIKMAQDANIKAAEDQFMAAVISVYSKYQHVIERQHAGIERRVDIQIRAPRPEARLQFADDGLELLVRYPVEIRRAPDIDEEMTRQVLELIRKDEGLKSSVSGTPKIRAAVKGC